MFVRNTWYVVDWLEAFENRRVLGRRVLNEPLAIFQKEDKTFAAIGDVCPHRFAPLHLGETRPGDRLQCPYHGLEFDVYGRCVKNPHGSGHIPRDAHVKSYRVVERYGAVWIWMGDAEPAVEEIPDLSLFDGTDPDYRSRRDYLRLAADYALITDNLLDLSHVSFLHKGILGDEDTIPALTRVDRIADSLLVSRTMSNVRAPGLFDLLFKQDGGSVDLWADMHWHSPGCLVNEAGVTEPGGTRESGTGIYGLHLLTPETETSTHYHFWAARWNPRTQGKTVDADLRTRLSDLRRHAFENQDRVIIDAQQRNILDPTVDTHRGVFLEIDIGPTQYRRMLADLLKQETKTAHLDSTSEVGASLTPESEAVSHHAQ